MSQRDPRLDRLVEFDERSRNFPVRELVADQTPRSYTWSCPTVLDQGNDGACVGFSIAHEIAAKPAVSAVDYDFALGLYHLAQRLDDYPGEDYDGTSVLGGMKAATQDGYYSAYHWGFSVEDLILAVGYKGPVVLGINWYESMFDVDEEGHIHVDGDVAGGHAILCRGVSVKTKTFLLHNSWGLGWGINGTARISFADVERLLDEDGEACIPDKRLRVAA